MIRVWGGSASLQIEKLKGSHRNRVSSILSLAQDTQKSLICFFRNRGIFLVLEFIASFTFNYRVHQACFSYEHSYHELLPFLRELSLELHDSCLDARTNLTTPGQQTAKCLVSHHFEYSSIYNRHVSLINAFNAL